AHRPELDRAAGVVIFDSGIGRVTGFSLGGRKDLADPATQLVAPLKSWEASTLTTDAEWGTDNFDFMLEGVPTFVANQEEANYLINYHASSDTFDKVDIQQLKKHVAEAAELTLALANTPEPIGPRLNRAQVEQTLRWRLTWIALAAGFAVVVYLWHGRRASLEFVTGYVIELSLSVDNLFVFLMIFRYFRVAGASQHEVLFWSIVGALIMRGIFI